jgi:ParB/RepB/Spo0J family partition protein
MAKKTKPAPQKAATKKPSPAQVGCRYVESRLVSLALIDPSPYQPRLAIADEDLLPLAGSIARMGFVDAVWLRAQGERYELLDGERRWRAAKMAQASTVAGTLRADIFAASDAQARQLALLSVVHREDLGPIERARAYDRMLAAGDYAGQKELAEAMAVDQSTISNLLRLLKLPEDWQRRIISREISERHARAMLPFAKYPAIMAAFDEFFNLNLDTSDNPGMPSVSEWEEQDVPRIVHDATRSMDGMHGDRMYYHPRYGRVSIFEPSVTEEKQLKIIKLGDEQLATNVELWEELQERHLKEEAERKRRGEGETRGGETDQETPADEEVTAVSDESGDEDLPAEDGDVAGEIKKNVDKALDIVEAHWKASEPIKANPPGPSSLISHPSSPPENALRRWLLAYAQWLIADEIKTRCETQALLACLLLGVHGWGLELNDQELDEAAADHLEPDRKRSLTERLLHADIYQLEKCAGAIVSRWFFQPERGPMFCIDGEQIKVIAEALEIDIAAEFEDGPNVLTPRLLLEAVDPAIVVKWSGLWKVDLQAAEPGKKFKLTEKTFADMEAAIKDGRPMPAELKAAWKQIGKKKD